MLVGEVREAREEWERVGFQERVHCAWQELLVRE